MDVTKILAAAPWLKKAWKFTPPPLRVPLLILVAAVAIWQWWKKRDEPAESTSASEHRTEAQIVAQAPPAGAPRNALT